MPEKLGLKLSLLSYARSFHVITTHHLLVFIRLTVRSLKAAGPASGPIVGSQALKR